MDTLVKAMTKSGAIRIIVTDTTQTVTEAAARHQTLPTASAALGRTLSATAMLGSMMKDAGESVTVQINGKGPLGTILCEANTFGEVRGFVSNPDVLLINEATRKLDVGKAVGKDGTLRVIRNTRMKADFTGTVELQTGEIGDDFAYYFTVSEQTPSAVSLGVLVGKDNEILASGGLIIQMLPEATETDLLMAEDVVSHLKPISEMIREGMTPDEIALALFDEVEIMSVTTVKFQCSCSKERLHEALSTIDPEELELMIKEDKGAEIICHFCNTAYQFSEDELINIHRKS